MRDESIARNYAEALLALAKKANAATEWAGHINAIAGAVEQSATLQRYLSAPQVSQEAKIAWLSKGLDGKVPPLFVRFLQKLVMNRRQTLIPHIATEYNNLVDLAEGRVHARVTVSRETPEVEVQAISAALGKALGKTVVSHVTVNPKILGGVVVRVGDTVMDGSVKRRLERLRAQMAGR